jgi:CDP-paratose synthetase
MKILLTGATGFLGSHLCERLLKDNFQVTILKRRFSNIVRIRNLFNLRNLRAVDIDSEDLESVFQKHKFDIIIHVATEYGRNGESINEIFDANIILPVKLIELGIKYNVKTFINTDTYFNKVNLTHSSLINYSLSKQSLLIWLKHFSSKIQVITLNIEHVYGPYDSDSKFVEMLIHKIAMEKCKRVALTHGHQKRDFIYVSDVVNAFILLIKYSAKHTFSYKSIDVGTGKCYEIAELVHCIKRLSGSNTILGFGDLPYRHDEIMESKADIRQMVDLGWQPTITLEDGVRSIMESYSQRRC